MRPFLADVLPQHARQVSLPLAGLLHGVEQARHAGFDRVERCRRQQLPQAAEFLGPLAVIEPAVALPLAPRLEVEAGIDQPELVAVGQEAKAVAGPP